MDDAFGNWLAGFVDGEGCFTIVRTGVSYYCRFALSVRDDDREIVEEIRRQLGNVGTIYAKPHYGTSKPQIQWFVQTQADCRVLVETFDKFPLRAKKRRDYAVWREAVIYLCEHRGVRNRLERQTRMDEFQERLRLARNY